MAIVTIAQVLACAEDFEQMLAEFYANLSHRTIREGVRLLTDYMSRHRQRTHNALREMPLKSLNRIYKTPLPYEPHAVNYHCFEGVELGPNATEVKPGVNAHPRCRCHLTFEVLEPAGV